MKTIEVEVTEQNANDGIPGEADCCALAIALKETHFPEDHIIVEVNSDGLYLVQIKISSTRNLNEDDISITNFKSDDELSDLKFEFRIFENLQD